MSAGGTWDGTSVAKTLSGPNATITGSFTSARNGVDPETTASETQRSGTGNDYRAPEPPDPVRFAAIKAQAGRRSRHPVLEPTL